jgi:hypothetical protein
MFKYMRTPQVEDHYHVSFGDRHTTTKIESERPIAAAKEAKEIPEPAIAALRGGEWQAGEQGTTSRRVQVRLVTQSAETLGLPQAV